MTDDHAQRTLEQKALANVRAELDRVDPDAPVRTVDEAVSHIGKTLPIVIIALVVLAVPVIWGAERSRKAKAERAAVMFPGYAANVFRTAEVLANRAMPRRPQGEYRGTVEVSFLMSYAGGIQKLEVTRSSGDGNLDDLAISLTAAPRYDAFPTAVVTAGFERMALKGTWVIAEGVATFRPSP
jgi:hypothetical protein